MFRDLGRMDLEAALTTSNDEVIVTYQLLHDAIAAKSCQWEQN